MEGKVITPLVDVFLNIKLQRGFKRTGSSVKFSGNNSSNNSSVWSMQNQQVCDSPRKDQFKVPLKIAQLFHQNNQMESPNRKCVHVFESCMFVCFSTDYLYPGGYLSVLSNFGLIVWLTLQTLENELFTLVWLGVQHRKTTNATTFLHFQKMCVWKGLKGLFLLSVLINVNNVSFH